MATVSELEAALADLRASADELDKLDDELTARIPDVEEALRGLRLGVRISVEMGYDDEIKKVLAFDKYGQTWRLVVNEGPVDDPEEWTTTALASAPRDDRASVFEFFLDKLLLSAAGQIKGKVERRRQAIEETNIVVRTLKKAAAPRRVKS